MDLALARYNDLPAHSSALQGVSTIVHLADLAQRHDYNASNVGIATETMRAVVTTANLIGGAKVIYASSIYASYQDDGHYSSYGESKRGAEDAMTAARDGHVALRFPLVYAGDRPGGLSAIVRFVARGLPLPFGLATTPRALIVREAAVNAIVYALESHVPSGTYAVADREPAGLGEVARAVGRGLGNPARLFPVPFIDRAIKVALPPQIFVASLPGWTAAESSSAAVQRSFTRS